MISNPAVGVLQNRNKIRISKNFNKIMTVASPSVAYATFKHDQDSTPMKSRREERKTSRDWPPSSHHQAGIHWTSKGKRGRPKETRTALHGTLTAGGRQEDLKRLAKLNASPPAHHFSVLDMGKRR